MAYVSRLELNHPALGTSGGVALHTAIEDIYKKIGDNMADRYFSIKDLDAAASVDCDHNFNTAIGNLKFDVYAWNEGTGELTYLDETTTPKLSEIAIIAKVGDEKKQITVTNNSASQVDLGLVVNQEVIYLKEGDIKDVDMSGVQDGQVPVYDAATEKYKPGSSGDSSFKFQSISSDGTALSIKSGAIRLNDGRILYAAADLTQDVSGIANSDGDWTGFIDLMTLPASSIVNNRRVHVLTTANFTYIKSYSDDSSVDLSRYIPCGSFDRTSGVYSGLTTFPMRAYDLPIGADSSLVDSLDYTLIGAVGDASQLNSGHQLAASSFPAAAIGANLSWYNLPDLNDDSGNARTLTNVGTVPFTGNNIFGVADCPSFNGSSQGLSSSNPFFNPGNVDFTLGAWVYSSNWAADQAIFSQWEGSTNYSFLLETSTAGFGLQASTNGIAGTFSKKYPISITSGWMHVAIKYIASGNLIKLYVNGVLCIDDTLGAALWTASSPTFKLGHFLSTFWLAGRMDEFFFAQYAMSDNDIMKLQAAKYTHNKGMASNAQDWKWWIKTATDAQRRLDYDPIISAELNELFFDLSQEASTAYISRKLFSASQSGLAKASRGQTLQLTTDQLDSLLPLSHGLGVVPMLQFMVSNGTDYEGQDWGSVFTVNSTQIKIAGDSLVTLFGTGVSCILTYASGIPSSFVPNRFWNKVVASSAVALSVNDRLFADTYSVGAFTGTLPQNPSINDEIQVCDSKGNFGTNAFTFGRNGQNIMGSTENFDCDISGKIWRAVFIDSIYGWEIYY